MDGDAQGRKDGIGGRVGREKKKGLIFPPLFQ